MKAVKTLKFLLRLEEGDLSDFLKVMDEYRMYLVYYYKRLNYKEVKVCKRQKLIVKNNRVYTVEVKDYSKIYFVYQQLPSHWSSALKVSFMNQLVDLINLSAVQKTLLFSKKKRKGRDNRITIRLHKSAINLKEKTISIKYGRRGKSIEFRIIGNIRRLREELEDGAKIGEPTLIVNSNAIYLNLPLVKNVRMLKLRDVKPPLLIAAIDVNALHGFTIAYVYFRGWSDYTVIDVVRFKPPSVTSRLKAVQYYQSRQSWGMVRKIYRNIRNMRRDFVEKASHSIVENLIRYSRMLNATPIFAYENIKSLNASRELRKQGLPKQTAKAVAKAINLMLRSLIRRTVEKLQWNGVASIYVDPRGTSKTCCICGLSLKQLTNRYGYRVMMCRSEHLVERDANAAINIAKKR